MLRRQSTAKRAKTLFFNLATKKNIVGSPTIATTLEACQSHRMPMGCCVGSHHQKRFFTVGMYRGCGIISSSASIPSSHARISNSQRGESNKKVGWKVHGGSSVSLLWQQHRHVAWNALNPFNSGFDSRSTNPQVESELPEVFAAQPHEVEDYIKPEKTFFETVEDWWDWLVTFFAPVEKTVSMMTGIEHNGVCGIMLGWGGTFVFWGICLRLCTLAPQLYAHRNALRMQIIAPQVGEINNLQKKIQQDKSLSTAEKRVIKEGYNRMKQALYTKHKCAQWKTFLQAATSPLMVCSLLAIRRLATYDVSLENAPFLWVKDLSLSDPTYMLPLFCNVLFLLNYELNQKMTRGAGRSAGGMYMRWFIRCGTIGVVYFFASQPSALFCYWIGLSVAGMLQPLILRWMKFREFFNFPPPPAAAKAAQQYTLWRTIMTKMGKKPATTVEVLTDEEKAKQKLASFQTIKDFEVMFNEDDKEAMKPPTK